MYIGAAACIWFLRAWKLGELERVATSKEEREREIRDDDAVRERSQISRQQSRSSGFALKGFWSWQRV